MRLRAGSAVLGVALTVALAVGACGDDDVPPAQVLNGAPDAGAEAASQALCVDGKPTAAYPPGPYEMSITSVVPQGLVFPGPDGDIAIDAFFEPCAERSRILVVRNTAAWCGTCEWHVKNDAKVLGDPRFAGRLVLVDLVIADRDNMPARPETTPKMDGWRVGVDPRFTFGAAQLSKAPLPVYVFIDTKTMKILSTASDPDPVALGNKLAIELSFLDRAPRPEVQNGELYDGLFTENQRDMIRDMKLGDLAAPPDPTNEYGDDAAAAALGKKLFEDKGLTPSGTVSCATCHDPKNDFTDAAPQSTGLVRIDRNAPALALAAHARWQFWDGRADTLWAQALGPFEDAREMGSSRAFIAQQIKARYATEYEAIFGAKYPLATTEDTRVYVNVGKAIAAFERSLRVAPNKLDAYAGGDLGALTQPQKEALQAYFKVGCAQCHYGPRLTDDAFHVIRFPTGRQDKQPDKGRYDVLATLAKREFVASSKWSDAPQAAKLLDLPVAENMLGAFRTPPLRGLHKTGPFGHGGTLATLLDVAKHYGTRGLPHDDPRAIGTTEQWVPQFDANVQAQLPAFLEVLTGDAVVPP